MGMATTEEAECQKLLACLVCKLTFKDGRRDLCARCLNKSLQQACYRNVFDARGPSRTGSGTPRVNFPGMPRAVMGPFSQKSFSKTSMSHRSVMNTENCISPGVSAAVGSMAEVSTVFSSPPSDNDVRSAGVDVHARGATGRGEFHGNVPAVVTSSLDCQKDCSKNLDSVRIGDIGSGELLDVTLSKPEDSCVESTWVERKSLDQDVLLGCKPATNCSDKWHLFHIPKNLTVKISNPPCNDSKSRVRIQLPIAPSRRASCVPITAEKDTCVSFPAKKETCPRNSKRPSRVKQWSLQSDPNAEADLMARLLADSVPILKSKAPLVLPPCEIRPVPTSPPTPPGDPLWKRRCIPCPLSLEVQVPLVQVK